MDSTGEHSPAEQRRRLAAERRRQAAELRAEGLSIVEIAERLAVSPSAVNKMLGDHEPAPIKCRECGQIVGELRCRFRPKQGVLCLGCLTQRPDAPFGDRLRTFRVGAGLSIFVLARRTGIARYILDKLENFPQHCVRWADALQLVKVFGVSLLVLGLERLPRPEQ